MGLLIVSDTLFADISEYQDAQPDARYPYKFISIRANDGTFRDKQFPIRLAWCLTALQLRKLVGFLVYTVFEENWEQATAVFKIQYGAKHIQRSAVVIDVERWKGRITGDHSPMVNSMREAIIAYLYALRPAWQRSVFFRAYFRAQDRKRVVLYGNAGDLAELSPHRGDAKIIIANYSFNPSLPGKIAHQFSDHYWCPPFGYVDMNSADGYSPWQFARALGMGTLRRTL